MILKFLQVKWVSKYLSGFMDKYLYRYLVN